MDYDAENNPPYIQLRHNIYIPQDISIFFSHKQVVFREMIGLTNAFDQILVESAAICLICFLAFGP
jgi:hypothetical protein